MSDSASDAEVVTCLAALIIAAVLIVLMLRGYGDCSKRGGSYVRTAVWFACIDVKGQP